MFDILLLRPSLYCNTPLHFTTLHHTSPNYTSLHFATRHHTSPNYTSLHLSTLHFLSFILHYPFIQLYAFTFPIVLFHFTSHHYTRHSTDLISKLISKIMNPFTDLKKFPPFHFTSLHFLFYFFTYPINPTLHFTLLFITTTHFPSLFIFYRLHFPSLVFTFLNLLLKMCVLPCMFWRQENTLASARTPKPNFSVVSPVA